MRGIFYLLADGNPFSHMGRNFRAGGDRAAVGELVLLGAFLVAIGVAVWLLVRHFNARDRVGYRSPRALFGELCNAHQLDRQQRRVLKQLARRHRLDQPARVFLEPERFEKQFTEAMPADDQKLLESLRDRLLGA